MTVKTNVKIKKVSGLVRRAGGDAYMQMILSSIAESGREALSGPISSMFSSSSSQQSDLDKSLDEKYYSKEGNKPTLQQYLTEYQNAMTSQQSDQENQASILRGASKVLSFVSLATGFAGSFLLGPVGPLMFTALTTYLATGADSLKDVYKKAFNPVKTAISNSRVSDYVRNNKKKVLNLVGIGVWSATMMGLQVLLPSLNFFWSTLSLGFTIGMVKEGTKNSKYKWLSDKEIIYINEADNENMQRVCIELINRLAETIMPELRKLQPSGEFSRFMKEEFKIDIRQQQSYIRRGKMRVLSTKTIKRLINKIESLYKEKMIKDPKLEESRFKIIQELKSYYRYAEFIRRTRTELNLKESGTLYKRVALIENLRQVFPKVKNIPLKDIYLSYLLFGDKLGSKDYQLGQFLNAREKKNSEPWIKNRINPSVLFGMDYKIQKLTLHNFKNVKLNVDLKTLKQVKISASQVIKSFFLMNPYSVPYVVYETSSGNAINRQLIYDKYDFIRTLYFAFCEEYGDVLSFTGIDKIAKEKFGIRWSIGDYLTSGSDLGINKIRDLHRVINHFKNNKYKSEALKACKSYSFTLQNTKKSMIGDFAHYCYEYFTIDYILSLDIDAEADYELILPNDRIIDNIFEWNSEIKARMNDIYSIDPKKYKAVMVDYSMASKPDRVLGKLSKGYHSDDRFLLIVLYAKKNPQTVMDLQKQLSDRAKVDSSLDSVKIITLEEYLQFLGVGGKHLKLFRDVNNLVVKASSHNSGAFNQLEDLMRKYQSALLAHDHIDFFYRYLGWAKNI